MSKKRINEAEDVEALQELICGIVKTIIDKRQLGLIKTFVEAKRG